MRRLFIIFNLFIFSFCVFAQQTLPDRIIGCIPANNSAKLYQIQVGAFKLDVNAENTVAFLKRNNFNAATEKYMDFTRVIVRGIPASQVNNYLVNLKRIGFNEVIIRDDISISISEKWEINIPESEYASFEFNHDMNYIAVANDHVMTAYFGTYYMPQSDIIVMEDIGKLKIRNNNSEGVDFSFSSVENPEREINVSAVKSEKIAASSELDLFCRSWLVVNCSDPDIIGCILFISNAGTYFITEPDGEINTMSKWRWYGNNRQEFEYSHDNWYSYGRARITDLSIVSLGIFDPGFLRNVPGYSRSSFNDQWELVPVR